VGGGLRYSRHSALYVKNCNDAGCQLKMHEEDVSWMISCPHKLPLPAYVGTTSHARKGRLDLRGNPQLPTAKCTPKGEKSILNPCLSTKNLASQPDVISSLREHVSLFPSREHLFQLILRVKNPRNSLFHEGTTKIVERILVVVRKRCHTLCLTERTSSSYFRLVQSLFPLLLLLLAPPPSDLSLSSLRLELLVAGKSQDTKHTEHTLLHGFVW